MMGYRIQYGISRVDKLSDNRTRKWVWIAAVILPILVVSAGIIWPEWMKSFRDELIPVFSEEGGMMVEAFMDHIKAQGGMKDAIHVFIQDVIADVSH